MSDGFGPSAVGDEAQLAAWVAFCVASPGRLPPDVTPVQTRLVRAVGRGRLPGGAEVFLKVMGFPRPRDRLRYWLRALPGPHEAAMLVAAKAADVPCPTVVAVSGCRGRLGVPVASILATQGLDLLPGSPPGLQSCSAATRRLLDAGIWHPDLHEKNFVRLGTGAVAVLDLQSARQRRHRLPQAAYTRAAGRLLAADWPESERADAVVQAGLVEASDLPAALRLATRLRADAVRRRVRRCLVESTEFCVFRRPWGRLIQRRTLQAGGVWRHGGRELIRLWLGARLREVVDREPPCLAALFLNSWWFPGRCSVYIAGADGVARFEERCGRWLDAYHRFKDMTGGSRRSPQLHPHTVLPWSGRRED